MIIHVWLMLILRWGIRCRLRLSPHLISARDLCFLRDYDKSYVESKAMRTKTASTAQESCHVLIFHC